MAFSTAATDAAGSAHLLAFDSVHGRWPQPCAANDDAMQIGEQRIAYSSNREIAQTDWSDCDIVIEATGRHHKRPETLAAYLDQGGEEGAGRGPNRGRTEHRLRHQS